MRATIQQIRDFKWRSSLLSPSLNPNLELEKRAFILWLSLPLVLGFTLISGYQQILPAWKMPGYWTATIFISRTYFYFPTLSQFANIISLADWFGNRHDRVNVDRVISCGGRYFPIS